MSPFVFKVLLILEKFYVIDRVPMVLKIVEQLAELAKTVVHAMDVVGRVLYFGRAAIPKFRLAPFLLEHIAWVRTVHR